GGGVGHSWLARNIAPRPNQARLAAYQSRDKLNCTKCRRRPGKGPSGTEGGTARPHLARGTPQAVLLRARNGAAAARVSSRRSLTRRTPPARTPVPLAPPSVSEPSPLTSPLSQSSASPPTRPAPP